MISGPPSLRRRLLAFLALPMLGLLTFNTLLAYYGRDESASHAKRTLTCHRLLREKGERVDRCRGDVESFALKGGGGILS